MKKYGVIVAIERELLALLNSSEIKYEVLEKDPFTIYYFEKNGKGIYVAHSSAGIIDSSLCTQILIARYKVDTVLNYGVVGALSDKLNVGELLVVDRVVKHDIDFSFEGSPIGTYTDVGEPYFYASKNINEIAVKCGAKSVTLASGDQFIADRTKKDYLRESFDADICDMEGAGIARTCYKYKTPFFMVKCISDTLNGGGVKEFDKYVVECGNKAFAFLLNLIEKL